MAKMTEEKAQEEYNERMFGIKAKTLPKDKNKPAYEKVKLALKYAHEIRQFEIRLYWQRSLFFWGFIITFLGTYALFLNSENHVIIKAVAAISLSGLGFFTTFAWRYIEIGSKSWQNNWEQHIDFLENEITGKLHKTVLGTSSKFYSISNIHASFILSMIYFWGGLFVLSIGFAFFLVICYVLGCDMSSHNDIKACFPMLWPHFNKHILIYAFVIWGIVVFVKKIHKTIIYKFFYLKEKPFEHHEEKPLEHLGEWRSSRKTIPQGLYSSYENAIHKRNLPEMHTKLGDND